MHGVVHASVRWSRVRVPPAAAAGLSTSQDEIVEFAVRELDTGLEFDSGLISIAQSVTRREVRSSARLGTALLRSHRPGHRITIQQLHNLAAVRIECAACVNMFCSTVCVQAYVLPSALCAGLRSQGRALMQRLAPADVLRRCARRRHAGLSRRHSAGPSGLKRSWAPRQMSAGAALVTGLSTADVTQPSLPTMRYPRASGLPLTSHCKAPEP
jgi:hypothetical protein